jgi:hypothetical protein
MPDLIQLLKGYDQGLLNIIAEHWEIPISEQDEISIPQQISTALLEVGRSGNLMNSMADLAQAALQKLAAEKGRMPVPAFVRQFGEIRAMGAGRRGRERPDQNPSSPAEILWYAGLIGKAFLDSRPEPQEFIFIPDDLLAFLPVETQGVGIVLGGPAAPDLIKRIHPASDHILDDACTLLAALRMGLDLEKIQGFKTQTPVHILKKFLAAAGLIDQNHIPIPETTRQFLEAPRAESFALLFSAWLNSPDFNELLLLPNLTFEGELKNDPLHTRQKILQFFSQIPPNTWCDLSSFISDIHTHYPDFQRPAGDYDSWFIRRKKDQAFLRGFASWNEVDGALLRFFINGILHWSGFLDLASSQAGGQITAFRLSKWAKPLMSGQVLQGLTEESKPLRINSDGQIAIPRECPRTIRYQIARSCQWLTSTNAEYRYQLTSASLEKAVSQGLKTSYLLSILRRHNQGPLPPNIIQALERWDKYGSQVVLKNVEIITLQTAEMMTALRNSPAKRYLLDAYSLVTASIQPGSKSRIMRALLDLGYLTSDISGQPNQEATPEEDKSKLK